MRVFSDLLKMVVVVVHVDDMFGKRERCDQFGADLNRYVPITDLGELRWYAGRRFSRDRVLGTVTISQQAVAERIVVKFGVTQKNKNTPMVVGLKLDEFDPNEPDVTEPFRSLVGHLMWLANLGRPDIVNAVRTVVRRGMPTRRNGCIGLRRCTSSSFTGGTTGLGITFQRGYGALRRLRLWEP